MGQIHKGINPIKIIVRFPSIRTSKQKTGLEPQFFDQRPLNGKLCLWIRFLNTITDSLLPLSVGRKVHISPAFDQ